MTNFTCTKPRILHGLYKPHVSNTTCDFTLSTLVTDMLQWTYLRYQKKVCHYCSLTDGELGHWLSSAYTCNFIFLYTCNFIFLYASNFKFVVGKPHFFINENWSLLFTEVEVTCASVPVLGQWCIRMRHATWCMCLVDAVAVSNQTTREMMEMNHFFVSPDLPTSVCVFLWN
jgi:hypothetical protein